MGLNLNNSFGFSSGGTGGGGGTVTAANNGLSLNGTTVVLGQDVGQAGDPAILLSEREVPTAGNALNLRGSVTANGTNSIRFIQGDITLFGDSAAGQAPGIIINDNAPTGGGMALGITPATEFISLDAVPFTTGVVTFIATGNMQIGQKSATDTGLAAVASNGSFGIDNTLSGISTTIALTIKQDAAYASTTPTVKVLDSTGAEMSRISLSGNATNDDGSVYIGGFAGASDTFGGTGGGNNVGIGWKALNAVNNGFGNVAVGYYALALNTTGNRNMALGAQALASNLTGIENTAVGYNAGFNNTTGNRNTYLGYSADHFNWSDNVLIGFGAGLGFAGNPATPSAQNVVIGSGAARLQGYNQNNVVIGYNCLNNSQFSDTTVAVGASIVATGNPTNFIAIGYAITVNSSNVAVFGRSDQNIILGQTSSSDNGKKVQVNGNMSIATVNAVGANPVKALVWDTVTSEVLAGAATNSPSIRQLAANGSVLATDFTIVVDTSGGNINITVAPANVTGIVNIKKKGADANTITLTMSSGSIYADSGAQATFVYSNPGQSTSIQSDGTNVYVI